MTFLTNILIIILTTDVDFTYSLRDPNPSSDLCTLKWLVYNDSRPSTPKPLYLADVYTIDECKQLCIDVSTCTGFEFRNSSKYCYTYYAKANINDMNYNVEAGSVYYSLVRCSKGPTTCRFNSHGYEYVGPNNETRHGTTCQPWKYHSGPRSDANSLFPDGDVDDAKNYCRNPNRDPEGPWCHTSPGDDSYEYCDIPFCPGICESTELGSELYTGTVSVTSEGMVCATWNDSESHGEDNRYTYPDGSSVEAYNFCRNPTKNSVGEYSGLDGHDVLWCFEESSIYGTPNFCAVPKCNDTISTSTTMESSTELSTTMETNTSVADACRVVWLVDDDTRRGSPVGGNLTDIKSKYLCKKNCIDDKECQAVEFRYKTYECLKHYNVRSGILEDTVEKSVLYTIVRCSRGPTTCRFNDHGYEYVGMKNETRGGKTCQSWIDHNGPRSDQNSIFPDGDAGDTKNYCRNPNRDPIGPWCYTNQLDESYEYCDIPFCPGMSCTNPGYEMEYTGNISVTRTGMVCGLWKDIFDENGDVTFPDGSIAAAQNFCRSPKFGYITGGHDYRTWCYVEFTAYIQYGECQTICTVSTETTPLSTTTWESTSVQSTTEISTTEPITTEPSTTEPITTESTPANCKHTQMGQEYLGHLSVTRDNKTCVPWSTIITVLGLHVPPDAFPDGSVEAAQNYCRNPEFSTEGPYCITSISPPDDVEFGHCDVPFCATDSTILPTTTPESISIQSTTETSTTEPITTEPITTEPITTEPRTTESSFTTCRVNAHGYEYIGLKDVTRNGTKCHFWISHNGPRSNMFSMFPDGNALDVNNYCRNPNVDPGGPWCYISQADDSYEYCDIPFCPLDSTTIEGVEHPLDLEDYYPE